MAFITPLLKQRARFRVRIPSSIRGRDVIALFTRISGLEIQIDRRERRHGGSLIPFVHPTGVRHAEIGFEAGTTNSPELLNWTIEAARVAAGLEDDLTVHRRDVTVEELDRVVVDQRFRVVNAWRLHRAWPVIYRMGPYDGGSDGFLIERLTLVYDALEMVGGSVRSEVEDPRFLIARQA